MTVREIVSIPEPVLRRKGRKVVDFGPELQTLIDDMLETMRNAPGVGLAAPQVAASLRVIVVEYAEEEATAGEADKPQSNSKPRLYTLVNPEITHLSQEIEMGTEGCLSVPGFVGDVERPVSIKIKGQNRRGQPMRLKAEGWLARIFLHEIDHLNGVLFIDRAMRVWQPAPDEAVPLD